MLGVDGGTTKTIALIARLDGTVVGAGRGGGSNIYSRHTPAPLANVEAAVLAALRSAGIKPADLIAGAFGMCGADWPEDFDFFQAEMERRGFGEQVVIANDAVGGLYAGLAEGPGVAVVCGTGAATAARAPDGRVWHSSFWQEDGGASRLGHETLRAVYRADLGIDPATRLTRRVLDYFGQSSVEQLLHRFTARLGTPPTNVAGLARVVLDEADGGDPTARRIVAEQGSTLGDYAVAATRRVGIEGAPFTLVLAGGVFRHPSRLLGEALIARVRATSPQMRAVNSRFEPAAGVLLLALEAAGIRLDEALLATMVRTLPPTSLFET